MQQLVRILITGTKASDAIPELQVVIPHPETKRLVYITLEQLGRPPFNKRIVQMIHDHTYLWIAIVEDMA